MTALEQIGKLSGFQSGDLNASFGALQPHNSSRTHEMPGFNLFTQGAITLCSGVSQPQTTLSKHPNNYLECLLLLLPLKVRIEHPSVTGHLGLSHTCVDVVHSLSSTKRRGGAQSEGHYAGGSKRPPGHTATLTSSPVIAKTENFGGMGRSAPSLNRSDQPDQLHMMFTRSTHGAIVVRM